MNTKRNNEFQRTGGGIQDKETWIIYEINKEKILVETFRTKMAAENWVQVNYKNFVGKLIIELNPKVLNSNKIKILKR